MMKKSTAYSILAMIILGIMCADVIAYGWKDLLSWFIMIAIPSLIYLGVYLIFSVIYWFNQ